MSRREAHGRNDPAGGLLERFVRACTDAGARAPAPDVEAAGMDLLRRWSGAERGYHDRVHLTEVLDRLHEIGGDAATAAPTRLAAWFHDAVYTGTPGADEQRSADLARRELVALGVGSGAAGRVADLVLVTAGHEPAAGDGPAEALCDADLAVLASGPTRYAAYVVGVRREHAGLDDEVFRAGRAAVLERLVGREHLFRTGHGRTHWEAAARANVAAELDALRGGRGDD